LLQRVAKNTEALGGPRGPLQVKLLSRAERGARGKSDVFIADEAQALQANTVATQRLGVNQHFLLNQSRSLCG